MNDRVNPNQQPGIAMSPTNEKRQVVLKEPGMAEREPLFSTLCQLRLLSHCKICLEEQFKVSTHSRIQQLRIDDVKLASVV